MRTRRVEHARKHAAKGKSERDREERRERETDDERRRERGVRDARQDRSDGSERHRASERGSARTAGKPSYARRSRGGAGQQPGHPDGKRERRLPQVQRQALQDDDLDDDETRTEQRRVDRYPARQARVAPRQRAAKREEDRPE